MLVTSISMGSAMNWNLWVVHPGACNYDPLADLTTGLVFMQLRVSIVLEGHITGCGQSCLNAIEYVCEQHSVVAAEGDIYGGMPEDIPAFGAVTDQSDLSMWGDAHSRGWTHTHANGGQQQFGAIFSGANDGVVDTAGTIKS